jgi:hypothetical protein
MMGLPFKIAAGPRQPNNFRVRVRVPIVPQIRDFHFRGLLSLAGLRWRYSNPHTHWIPLPLSSGLLLQPSANRVEITSVKGSASVVLCMHCAGNVFSSMVTEPVLQQRRLVLLTA